MKKISDHHPDYDRASAKWARCRDFIAGADELRAHDIGCAGRAGAAYIERLPGQSDDEYAARVYRALYYNAVGRTLDGLAGLAMSAEPEADLPGAIDYMLEDADGASTPLPEFAEAVLREVLAVGRCGVLVDRPPSTPGASRLDEERAGIRSRMILYRAEDLIDWSPTRIGVRTILGRVVLTAEPAVGEDGKAAPQLLELVLEPWTDDAGNSFPVAYVAKTWRLAKNAQGVEEWSVVSTAVPLLSGKPLEEIPFRFFGPSGSDWRVSKPPLLDLVEVARSHYQTSAELEHGRFFLSLPTPVFSGFGDAKELGTVRLGSMEGIVSSSPDAKATYLEFTGQGLGALERALKDKAEMMAKLGSRMLAEDKKDAEAAETLRIRASGESATLADIARAVSRILGQLLAIASLWNGGAAEGEITLSTDYTPAGISAQELVALTAAVQGGHLPRFDYFAALKAGGIIGPDRTYEDYVAETPEEGLGLLGAESGAVAKKPATEEGAA